ncbi:Rid family detoxifying hydrolase [uncultured Eudoraea sp.]|uniref:RidA family protein n=1 Tax=uncultured Eudoraea sp. TaxID=1035614 RepID=UPI002601A0F1|nr:Rid family detoxifying hydrolase [uncultured Eudoraea sp.]
MKKYLQLIPILTLIWCSTVSSQEDTGITFHESHEKKKRSAPFSDVVEAGNLFFLAGQIGMDHGTRTMVTPGIKTETEQAIKNIQDVLKHHGLTLNNVVKCTVILSTMDDFSAFNEVYTKYFTKKPARTTFAASGLARNAKVEIDVIAVKN